MSSAILFLSTELTGMNHSDYKNVDIASFFKQCSKKLTIALRYDKNTWICDDMNQLAGFYPRYAKDFHSMTRERFVPLRIIDEIKKIVLPCVYLPHTLLLKQNCKIDLFAQEKETGNGLCTCNIDGEINYEIVPGDDILLRDIAQKIELERVPLLSKMNVSCSVAVENGSLVVRTGIENPKVANDQLEKIEKLKNELRDARRAYNDIKFNRNVLARLVILLSTCLIVSGIINILTAWLERNGTNLSLFM